MQIKEYLKKVKSKEISVIETISKILDEAKKLNKDYNYFNTISDQQALAQAKAIEKAPKGSLAGLPISVKDCISTKNIETTAGSLILKNYKPVYNATVIEKLQAAGAIIIGKTSQDEFGFGGFSVNTYNIPKNPFDKERSCGGSSGGAAGFTQKTSLPHIALAESTGGSIVNPASFCGVIGLCPTYGLVSRYGLLDYASSLDKIGPITKSIEDAELALSVIAGYDSKDSTSLNKQLNKNNKIKSIALIKESLDIDPKIKDLILKKLNQLKIKYDTISLPLLKEYGIACYYIIAMSEASTNLAKYCGIRYGLELELEGNFDEYFSKVRSAGFGKEAKRRIILGTFARMAGFRDAYYLKAMKLRTLIINEYKKAFKKYDLLVSPTMPITAPKFSEINKLTPLQNYMMDILTVGPNLAGLPHLSLNAGFINKLPSGILFIADHLNENKLIEIGKKLEIK